MSRINRILVAFSAAVVFTPGPDVAGQARISEQIRSLETYPFSDPNPIPMLVKDARLYPYHSFDGYAHDSEARDWKVVVLENEYIEVFVLPEVGGKVWGAIVKETGHEFIYRNEVMKFRNIALRGPWTSGGIEFNFGVIGHTPATATPVDYTTRENDDGSVSVFVGAMDLPSRTHWRVEVRLPADKAYFETRALWYNPTPLAQPYYNWMTAAAFARDDLVMSIPGDQYLKHSGEAFPWPTDSLGRDLAPYDNNRFEGNKSYHVVGELNDFFGGYYEDADYGFGHWSRHEEMPGQKLWLWALSRQGGIWEDLLTDTDGQYVEFQAGRLFVQYQPAGHVNPITEAVFEPMSASRWTETWFPLEGTGGLSDASPDGAMHVERTEATATITVSALTAVSDTLRIWADGVLVASESVDLSPLETFATSIGTIEGEHVRVTLPALRLDYDSDPGARDLSRPFSTDEDATRSIPAADRAAFQARELMKSRRYAAASELFTEALAEEPWHRSALLGAAELAFRSGHYERALRHVNRTLEVDAYDAEANFLAGTIYQALDRPADARDAYGWATRSTGTRSAAYAQLARVMMKEDDLPEARRYARLAIDFDRYSIPAWRSLSVLGRLMQDSELVAEAHTELRSIDPLDHFVRAEEHVARGTSASADALTGALGGEYPAQTLLELALTYRSFGQTDAARELLSIPTPWSEEPILLAWRAYLSDADAELDAPVDLAFSFPFRRETLDALAWAAERNGRWEWSYLYALNLWAVNRAEEASDLFVSLGDEPDFAPFYVARGRLLRGSRSVDGLSDHYRAVDLAPGDRLMHVALAQELEASADWNALISAATNARSIFPDDFNLALFEARALVHLDRPTQALEILVDVQVLPSEHARGTRQLFSDAHTMVALDAMEVGDSGRARGQLEMALEWPESLGEGRPYDPDDRLIRLLLGIAEAEGSSDRAASEAGLRALLAAAPPGSRQADLIQRGLVLVGAR